MERIVVVEEGARFPQEFKLAHSQQMVLCQSDSETRGQFMARLATRLERTPRSQSALLVLNDEAELEHRFSLLGLLADALDKTRRAEVAVLLQEGALSRLLGWSLLEKTQSFLARSGVSFRFRFGAEGFAYNS